MNYYSQDFRLTSPSLRGSSTNSLAKIELFRCEQFFNFIALTYKIRLSPEGKGGIAFNTSTLNLFTIAVKNIGSSPIDAYLKSWPDPFTGIADSTSRQTIAPNVAQTFIGKILLKYTSIELEGLPNSEALIFFQAQYPI